MTSKLARSTLTSPGWIRVNIESLIFCFKLIGNLLPNLHYTALCFGNKRYRTVNKNLHNTGFSCLSQTNVAHLYPWDARCRELTVKSLFTFSPTPAIVFLHFPLETLFWFVRVVNLSLLTEIGIPILVCLHCSRRVIPTFDKIMASLFLISDAWLLTVGYLQ